MPDPRQEALAATQELIGLLRDNLSSEWSDPASLGYFFTKEGKGGLHLDSEESAEFRFALDSLHSAFVRRDESSKKTVESLLQDAILDSVFQQEGDSADFDERLSLAIGRLNKELTQPLSPFECIVSLRGIGTDDLPETFGGLCIAVCSELTHGSVSSVDRSGARDDASDADASRVGILEQLSHFPDWNQPAVAVRVMARDSIAAQTIALHEAQRLVDRINFFHDLTRYQLGHIYLPGNSAPDSQLTIQIDPAGVVQGSAERKGPVAPFSFKKLREARNLKRAVPALERLLADQSRGSFHEAIVSSVEWAGRATVSPRRQEAFLLFAIALEAVLLPASGGGELRYRFSLRLAHLVGNSTSRRADIAARARKLYDVRSKVVHNGSYEVTDSDLEDLRAFSKLSILKILLNDELMACSAQEDAQEWFEAQALG